MSYDWAPYVSVAKRRANALKKMEKLRKQGIKIYPIEIEGRKIAKTFWGNAWCTHLEKFSDFKNRLPRGRTYVRNGSVCHLEIKQGLVIAMVAGSEMYNIKINIAALPTQQWQAIQEKCAGGIGSVLELLKGKLSDNIMQTVTDRKKGLFPLTKDIRLNCDCPDWATMCKHVAAVLYGVGARLDQSPELLFLLRGVDHMDLVQVEEVKIPQRSRKKPQVSGDLSDVFGIDLEEDPISVNTATESKTDKKEKNKTTGKTSNTKRLKKTNLKRFERKSEKQKTSNTLKEKINISRGIRASHIKKLRKVFAMSESEFAQMLGKSVITIRHWEAKKGILDLQRSSQAALEKVLEINKTEAWKRLGKK